MSRHFVADARRGEGKHLIVRADENLIAFVELEAALEAAEIVSTKKSALNLN